MATRDVQFIIRARDEASRAFDGITNALQQLSGWNGKTGESSNILSNDLSKLVEALGSVDQVARLVGGASQRAGDAFEQQRAKVKALEGDLANLKAQAAAAEGALSSIKSAGSATGNHEAEAAQIKAVQAAQADLEKQIQRKVGTLDRERVALEGLSKEYQRSASLENAFNASRGGLDQGQQAAQSAQALQEQSAWLDRIRQQLTPAAAIQQHYREEIERANAARAAGLYKTEAEYQAVIKLLNVEQKRALAQQGVGPSGRPSLLGLTPWQSTNLMYQVNDVVSGLAMGQKPSQIIAQQLGQIIQLFPRLGSGIMAAFSNPYFLGAAAVFTTIAFAVKQAADQEDRLRSFSAILMANADGAKYSAQALEQNVEALKKYHLSADDATAITKTFIKEGLNPSYITSFGQSAKDLSRVLGTDVKDAATQVAQAFTGGYDAVAKLDDATNYLTATDRNHIRVLFDQGKAAEARKLAFDKFAESQHAAAEEMKGPWATALDKVSTSWEELKDSLADSSFANDLLTFLESTAKDFENLAALIDKVNQLTGKSGGGTREGVSDTPAPAQAGGKPTDPNDPRAASQADQKAVDTAKLEIQLQRTLQIATSDWAKARAAALQAYTAEMEKSGNKELALLRTKAAAEQVITGIQMQRRQGLLSTAQGFLGKRENVREDRAALESLFSQYGIKTPQGGSVDPQKLAWCAAFVNAMLASKGLPTTGSLAASSFSSYGKGVKVEEAQPGDIVVLDHHVGFFAGFGPNGTVRILGGNQGKSGAGAVSEVNFKRSAVKSVRRVGAIGEGFDGQDSEAQYAIQQGVAQDAFNHKLEIEAANRALVLKYMREQLGMSADQLYNSQRQEAIEQAIVAAKQDATDKNLTFGPDQEATVRKQVGDQFDLEHGMALVNDRIKEQTDLRSALMAGIAAAEARGDDSTVARLTAQLNGLTPALEDAITKAEQFWQALPDSPAKAAALEGFRQLREEVSNTAAALAKLKLDAATLKIQGAQSLQGALASGVDQAQLLGDKNGARAADDQLRTVNDRLVELRQNAIDAATAMLSLSDAELAAAGQTREGLEATILGLKQAQNESKMLGRQFLMTGKQINESLADGAVNAIDNFFQKVAQGTNIVEAFWQSLVQGIADFLRQIALAILKQTIFNALNHGGPSGGGGTGGMIATAIASLFHGGGVAGAHQMSRSVSPGVFSGAARYHTGGLAGLQPDEVPAILRKGEEVLTDTNPRHRKNAGRDAPGAASRGIRQVLAIGDEEIAKAALGGAAGEELLFTWLRRNRSTIRQELG